MGTAVLLLAGALSACGGPSAVNTEPPGQGDAVALLGEQTWELVEGEVDGAAVVVPDGHRVTLVLEQDRPDAGQAEELVGAPVGGTAACNGYGARAQVDGTDVRIGRLSATEMGCAPDVMAVESLYLDALTRVATGARDGDRLVLSGEDVTLAFAGRPPVPTEQLVGTTWLLSTLVDGEVAASVSGEPALLRLEADGTLTGSTGCRDLTGRYVVTGDEVLLTDLSAGDRECPPELAEQDGHVVQVLGDGFRAEVDGSRLTLSSTGDVGLVYVARPDGG